MRAIVTVGLMLLGTIGCGDHTHSHAGVATQSVCPSSSALTYQSFGKQFFQDYCSRCHAASVTGAARQGAPDEQIFDTREQIVAESEHLDTTAAAGPAAANTSMPPSSPTPTEAQRRQLGEWLACGGK
jgi:uncharacterized membrane protein